MSDAGWDLIALDDLDSIPVAGVVWHPIRRPTGLKAFGLNAYSAVEVGDHVIEDHTEVTEDGGGHEEVYLVLRGHATFTIDGETRAAPAGSLVVLRDPRLRRSAVADEEGTLVLAIGSDPRHAHEISPWEFIFAAAPAIDREDWDEAIATISEGLELYPDGPSLLFNLACVESRAGLTQKAIGHLERAIAINDKYVALAATDTDFDPIRDEPGFPGSPR